MLTNYSTYEKLVRMQDNPQTQTSQGNNIGLSRAVAIEILVVLFIGFVGIVGYLLGSHRLNFLPNTIVSQVEGKSAISGTIDFNGNPPSNSSVSLGVRSTGSSEFKIFSKGLSPVDGNIWSYSDGQKGVAYEFQAYLVENGKTVAKSDIHLAVAPAIDESLRINAPASSSTNSKTTISGTMNLNGYIPTGSTISIAVKSQSASSFTNVITNLAAIDGVSWSYNSAKSGVTYTVQAQLVSGGQVISQSQSVTFTAPAYNETLTINSTAQSPIPATTAVSGTINLNGSVPSGATISIGSRVSGVGNFNTFASGVAAVNGVSWTWSGATSGTAYDFQAQVISNGSVVNTSQILTVAAPAVNEVLTINAQTPPSAPPSNSMTNSCASMNGGNQWQVTLAYNSNSVIQNAQQYQLTVGTSQGSNNLVNITTSPSSPNQAQTYNTGYLFNSGTTYYAQYAYSTCSNCGTFSAFSPALAFYCNPTPTPTPTNSSTPTPSSTPTLTPTTVPTSTPTFTPTPTNPAPTN